LEEQGQQQSYEHLDFWLAGLRAEWINDKDIWHIYFAEMNIVLEARNKGERRKQAASKAGAKPVSEDDGFYSKVMQAKERVKSKY
jgi:hypothetical protein